jgi:hypothetical protein
MLWLEKHGVINLSTKIVTASKGNALKFIVIGDMNHIYLLSPFTIFTTSCILGVAYKFSINATSYVSPQRLKNTSRRKECQINKLYTLSQVILR